MPGGDQSVHRDGHRVLQEPGPGHLHGEMGQRGSAQTAVHDLLQDLPCDTCGEFHFLCGADQLLIFLAGVLVLGRVDHPDLDLKDGVLEVDAGIGAEGGERLVDDVEGLLHGIHGGSARDLAARVEVGHQTLAQQNHNAADCD